MFLFKIKHQYNYKIMDINEDLRSKMEKCAAQFSTAFRSLSKVFALLGHKNPQNPETDSADDEKMEISEPEFGNSAPDLSAWQKLVRCRWGVYHRTDFAKQYIFDLRANNAKNVWRLNGDPNARTDWFRVADNVVLERYNQYTEEMLEMRIAVLHHKRLDTDLWNEVHRIKQARVYRVIEADAISLKDFYKLLQNRHAELPALRGLLVV
jgi:hypothetical protein